MANGDGGGRSITAKQVIAGVLILVVVILAIANSGKVEVDFVVGDVETRLFVVIVGAAAVGFLIGWFVGRNRKSD